MSVAHSILVGEPAAGQALSANLARLFLQECPKYLVAIDAAIDAGDINSLRYAARALRSASDTLAATGISEAASRIEGLPDGVEESIVLTERRNVVHALKGFAAGLSPCDGCWKSPYGCRGCEQRPPLAASILNVRLSAAAVAA